MPIVQFMYGVTKSRNSTARPAGYNEGARDLVFDCYLKEKTSVAKPVFIVDSSVDSFTSLAISNVGKLSNPWQYTYIYCPTFTRYYFITDWISVGGNLWECHCECDVMASFYNKIKNSTQFVERSSHTFDGSIVDKMCVVSPQLDTATQKIFDYIWTDDYSTGCYIVGIITNDSSAIGAISYYYFSPAHLRTFITQLFTTDYSIDSISEIGEELAKAIVDPFQYVVSCMFFPFYGSNTLYGPAEELRLGWWTVPNITVNPLTTFKYTNTLTYTGGNPQHPQAASVGTWLNSAPFSQISFYFPGFGDINIDPVLWGSSMTFQYDIDMITGRAMMSIADSEAFTGEHMEHRIAQIGIPIQLAKNCSDFYMGGIKAVGEAAVGVGRMIAGDVVGGLSNVGGSIASAINAITPLVSTSGSNGSIVEIGRKAKVQHFYRRVVPVDNAKYGKPLYRSVELSTIPGYILVNNPVFPAEGSSGTQPTAEELATIENYMQGGFYLE